MITYRHFLMHPSVFKLISKELTNMKEEFVKINGDTYQKYIIIILDNILTFEQKEEILQSKNDEDALKLLDKFNIQYSCEMT